MGCASGRESAGAFSLRGLKDGGLGEDLSRTFISFMLMYQKRFISFICPWVWLANGTNWISAVSLNREI